jgi:hypothetical protein
MNHPLVSFIVAEDSSLDCPQVSVSGGVDSTFEPIRKWQASELGWTRLRKADDGITVQRAHGVNTAVSEPYSAVGINTERVSIRLSKTVG